MAAVIGIVVAFLAVPGSDSPVGGAGGNRVVLLELHAPRDLGRLPARAGWCTIARNPQHCHLLQEGSGNAVDTGDSTEVWTMVPASGPRQGVHTPVPVEDATGWVDTTSELGAWSAADGYFRIASALDVMGPSADSTNVVTVHLLIVNSDPAQNNTYVIGAEGDDGWSITYSSSGNIRLRLNGASGSVTRSTTSAPVADGAPHCITAMMDGRTAGAGRLWVDHAEVTLSSQDMSGLGSWRGSARVAFFAKPNATSKSSGGILRSRVDFAAMTLADHDAICGTIWQPPSTDSHVLTKLAPADVSWTQTGGARCYAASATTAVCVPGGLPGLAWRAGVGLVLPTLEPDRTNRVLDSLDLSSANWSGDATSSVAAAVAPDGSKAAWTVTATDATTLYAVPTGYTASAPLSLRLWAKCSAGLLKLATDGAAGGAWTIDCATVGGAWAELHSTHAAVTEDATWFAASTGDATLIVTSDATGVTADLWLPTLTAELTGISVVPTGGAAVSTGAIAFEIDNDPDTYFKGGAGKITLVGDWIAGACFDTADSTDIGRTYGDGSDWFAFDNLGVTAFQCNLILAGVDTAVIRWKAAITLDATTVHAECLLNAVTQSWDATPSSPWDAATPGTIKLDGFGSTSCTAGIQTIRIENKP